MSRWASHRRSPYLSLRSFIASIFRTVPATRSPRARSCSVIRRPKPLFTPVISQVLDLRFGFIFFLCFFLLILFLSPLPRGRKRCDSFWLARLRHLPLASCPSHFSLVVRSVVSFH